ncbi:hypothetical protein NE599_21365, partial [[Clostridium] symbiosum]|uniref:hypothetical protein n=1 Tax=Clostridium symbiosum TaxID=1512 RepID=UPI00210F0AF7
RTDTAPSVSTDGRRRTNECFFASLQAPIEIRQKRQKAPFRAVKLGIFMQNAHENTSRNTTV